MAHRLFAKSSMHLLLAISCMTALSAVCGAQRLIRVRFINGKSGKPLRWKYPAVTPSSDGKVEYVFDRKDRYSFQAVIKNAKTISVNQGYYRCDSAKENDPAVSYKVEEIVEHGVVSANLCDSPQQLQPAKGELVVYTRHAHWWEMFRDIGKGLLICA